MTCNVKSNHKAVIALVTENFMNTVTLQRKIVRFLPTDKETRPDFINMILELLMIMMVHWYVTPALLDQLPLWQPFKRSQ